MTNKFHNRGPGARQRGFTLVEALVALVVMAFGMLALAGMQLSLSRNADVAKQRTEAMRLAQERVERMRSFTGLSTGTINWNGLDALGTETVTTNATYTITSAMTGDDGDAMRPVNVNVAWTDRANEPQSVALATVISRTDPRDPGFVGNPLPFNTPLRRPMNRNINIPIPSLDLGDGRSSYQFSPSFAILFSNLSGNVVQICDPGVANATLAQILAASCREVNGYIIGGYLYRTSDTLDWPTGINHAGVVRDQPNTTEAITCTFADATDQNSAGVTIENYKYYVCVVPLEAPYLWDGTIRIGGVRTDTNYIVCRYEYTQTAVTANERNIQPYVDVNMSLDLQNYLLTTTSSSSPTNSSCPSSMTVTGVSVGRLHQNCRSDNASVATACPAPS